jgi:hypothetical protein
MAQVFSLAGREPGMGNAGSLFDEINFITPAAEKSIKAFISYGCEYSSG